MSTSSGNFSDLRQAADAAFENRSEEDLNRVLRKCATTDRAVEEQIRGYKQQLGGGRR